jgi:hypothetical protein
MRGDARKRLADLQAEADNGFHHGIRAWVDNNSGAARVIQAIDPLAEIRTLAHQLLEDADTTHRDPFLRGCATGTTDTAQAILNTLGDKR